MDNDDDAWLALADAVELRHLQSQQPSLPAQQGLQTYGQHPAPSYPPLQQLSTFTAQQPHDRSAEGSSLSEHHHQQQRPTSGGSLWQQYSSAGPQTIAAQQAQAQQVASGPDRSSGGDMLPVSQPAVQQPRYQSATTVPSVSCAAQAPDMTACSRPSTGQLPAPRPPSGRLGQPAKQAQQRPNAGPLTQHVLPAKRPAPSNASQAPSAAGGGRQQNIASLFASQASSQPSQLAQVLAMSMTGLTGDEPAAACAASKSQQEATPDDRPALIPCNTTSRGIDVHRFNAKTWVYPLGVPERAYQLSIIRTALFHNTLVCLPTGLGKTLIAAVVMHNFTRWFPEGKVVFTAPTRPLVNQQIEACYKLMGVPKRSIQEMTGTIAIEERREAWSAPHKRIFFATPQAFKNDVIKGICPLEAVVCVVVDECHKAVGKFDMVTAIQTMQERSCRFRVLGLSATPGGKRDSVQEVLTNLMTACIEYRGEDDPDVQPYRHERREDILAVEHQEDGAHAKDLLMTVLRGIIIELSRRKVYFGNCEPDMVHHFAFVKGQQNYVRTSATGGHKDPAVPSLFRQAMTLTGLRDQLDKYSMTTALDYLNTNLQNEGAIRRLLGMNATFNEFKQRLEALVGRGGAHPKMVRLQASILAHLRGQDPIADVDSIAAQNAGAVVKDGSDPCCPLQATQGQAAEAEPDEQQATGRVIVFTSLRDSVGAIVDMLRKLSPLVAPRMFIGQGPGSKEAGSTGGMKQSEQKKVLADFCEGKFNVLVATCIAEEGLDIPQVDLIVCFDASASPIRNIQRIGRTGRHKAGRVIYILSQGREVDNYYKNKEAGLRLADQLREQQFSLYSPNPRMLPREFMPEKLDVDCSCKTPTKSPEAVKGGRGGGAKRGRVGRGRGSGSSTGPGSSLLDSSAGSGTSVKHLSYAALREKSKSGRGRGRAKAMDAARPEHASGSATGSMALQPDENMLQDAELAPQHASIGCDLDPAPSGAEAQPQEDIVMSQMPLAERLFGRISRACAQLAHAASDRPAQPQHAAGSAAGWDEGMPIELDEDDLPLGSRLQARVENVPAPAQAEQHAVPIQQHAVPAQPHGSAGPASTQHPAHPKPGAPQAAWDVDVHDSMAAAGKGTGESVMPQLSQMPVSHWRQDPRYPALRESARLHVPTAAQPHVSFKPAEAAAPGQHAQQQPAAQPAELPQLQHGDVACQQQQQQAADIPARSAADPSSGSSMQAIPDTPPPQDDPAEVPPLCAGVFGDEDDGDFPSLSQVVLSERLLGRVGIAPAPPIAAQPPGRLPVQDASHSMPQSQIPLAQWPRHRNDDAAADRGASAQAAEAYPTALAPSFEQRAQALPPAAAPVHQAPSPLAQPLPALAAISPRSGMQQPPSLPVADPRSSAACLVDSAQPSKPSSDSLHREEALPSSQLPLALLPRGCTASAAASPHSRAASGTALSDAQRSAALLPAQGWTAAQQAQHLSAAPHADHRTDALHAAEAMPLHVSPTETGPKPGVDAPLSHHADLQLHSMQQQQWPANDRSAGNGPPALRPNQHHAQAIADQAKHPLPVAEHKPFHPPQPQPPAQPQQPAFMAHTDMEHAQQQQQRRQQHAKKTVKRRIGSVGKAAEAESLVQAAQQQQPLPTASVSTNLSKPAQPPPPTAGGFDIKFDDIPADMALPQASDQPTTAANYAASIHQQQQSLAVMQPAVGSPARLPLQPANQAHDGSTQQRSAGKGTSVHVAAEQHAGKAASAHMDMQQAHLPPRPADVPREIDADGFRTPAPRKGVTARRNVIMSDSASKESRPNSNQAAAGWGAVSWGNGTQPSGEAGAEAEAQRKRAAHMRRLALAESSAKSTIGAPAAKLRRLRKGHRVTASTTTDNHSSDDSPESADEDRNHPVRAKKAKLRSAFVDDEAALSGSEDGSSDDDSEDQDAFEADFIDMASQPVCSQQLGHGDMMAMYQHSLLHRTPLMARRPAGLQQPRTPGAADTPSTYDLNDSFIDTEEDVDPYCRSSQQDGQSQHESVCTLCHREFDEPGHDRGPALLCHGCPCAVHAACLRSGRPLDPSQRWLCAICRDG